MKPRFENTLSLKSLSEYNCLGEEMHLAEFFKLFGEASRLRTLSYLSEGEMSVGDLAKKQQMTVSAVSHQLKLLKLHGLVRFRREGKTLYYSLADAHVETIIREGLEHIRE